MSGQLYLFGPPRLEFHDQPVEITLRKALALLAYLAVTGQMHSREALATLFWPETSSSRARASLRRTLHRLSQTQADEVLRVTPDTVGLANEAEFWLDTATYQQLVATHLPDQAPVVNVTPATVQHLMWASELYTGDFMAGFNLPDSPEFDEWQFFQRESLRQSLAQVLEQLVVAYRTQNHYGQAIAQARRWLSLDPLHEPVHCQLMRLYALDGQQAAALRQYEECTRILHAELNVPPEPETTELFEAIRTKHFPSTVQEADRQDAHEIEATIEQTTELPSTISTAADKGVTFPPPHNLPPQLTPFVGREQEIEEIRQLLRDESDCRLITLVGPGGIGKTRLALAVATHLLGTFTNGVFYVELVSLNDIEHLSTTVSEALHLSLQRGAEAQTQLCNYLRNKHLLLVMDNFEHLLDGAGLISDILNSAPQVTVLVTSRERLNLQEEWCYDLQGLAYPEQDVLGDTPDIKMLEAYEGIRLFLQRARRAAATFTPSATDMKQIVRICQSVDGMPLGLELAAPWIRTLSCQEIAAEIERNLNFLSTDLRNVPERHRSLKAIIDQTWHTLSKKEQSVLSKLSVFRGGCTREAAETVAEATLLILSALIDRALLHRNRSGRYTMHELVRQFASEKLSCAGGVQLQNLHSAYYASFTQKQCIATKTKNQEMAFQALNNDIDNIRAAWYRAITNCDIQLLEQASEFVWLLPNVSEAEATFRHAIEALQQIDKSSDPHVSNSVDNLLGFFLAGQGFFIARFGDYREGQALMERGIALLRSVSAANCSKLATALLNLGTLTLQIDLFERARQHGRESLALFREAADQSGEVACLNLLCSIYIFEGHLAQAAQLVQQGVVLCRKIGDRFAETGFIRKRAELARIVGEYTEAEQLLSQILSFWQRIGNTREIPNILRDLGFLAIAQGHKEKAMELGRQCLSIEKISGRNLNVTPELALVATTHRLMGNRDAAAHLYRVNLDALTDAGRRYVAARVSIDFGILLYQQQDFRRAEKLFQESYNFWAEINNEPELALALCHLGHVTVVDNRADDAKRYFTQALELAAMHQLAPVALDVFVGLAQLLTLMNETSLALKLLTLAEHHPASTYETKENARREWSALTGNLSAETATVAQANGQNLDWQEMTRRSIDCLTSKN